MNDENLIKNSDRTPSERRELARKAGKASGEARRRKRDSRELMLQVISSCPTLDKATMKNLQTLGIKGQRGKKYSIQMLMAVAIAQKAMRGDVRAYEAIRDTIGDKPQENVSVSMPDFSVLDGIDYSDE